MPPQSVAKRQTPSGREQQARSFWSLFHAMDAVLPIIRDFGNANQDGVEYNTEIELIVKRIHATTLAQPFRLEPKGFLESRVIRLT